VAETTAPLDEFPIEQIGRVHGIAAGLFIPFAIHRLTKTAGQHACDLDVELVGIGGVAHATRRLRITWQAESVLDLPPGVQENVVTEWAALGVAAAVVWQYAGIRIETAADVGDCFDYWVTDGERVAGLEVSGTLAADLKTRRREKARQLLDNPHGIDGYVAVVRFDRAAASVSFHRLSEIVP
jgi:hypothetical protein